MKKSNKSEIKKKLTDILGKELQKESELMKKLLEIDTGVRYNWENVKKELFEKKD